MKTLISKIEEETKLQLQKEWKECTKVGIKKSYFFPTVHDRQKVNIKITPIFKGIVTCHQKTRAYLHSFKILEHENCPCGNGDQTIDHLHYQCSILHTQIEILKRSVLKSGNWPAHKHVLISKYPNSFLLFKKSKNFNLLQGFRFCTLLDLLQGFYKWYITGLKLFKVL